MDFFRCFGVFCFILLLGQTETADYGQRCMLYFTSCDYEGGLCDIETQTCGCIQESYVFNVKTGKCEPSTPLGASCSHTDNCTDKGSVCEGNSCVCGDGLYDSRYPWLQLPEGQCLPYAELGSSCQTQDGCEDNYTVCLTDICKCASGFVAVNGTCQTAPGYNVKLAAVEDDPMSVYVIWQRPEELNGTVFGYMVFFTLDQYGSNWTVEAVLGDKRSVRVKDLPENNTVYFRVQGRTNDMFGPMSEIKSFKVQSECNPDSCTNITGVCCCLPEFYVNREECRPADETSVVGLKTYSGETSLNVTWSTPPVADVIECYHISWVPYINGTLSRDADDAGNHTVTTSEFNGSVEITGLVPGRAYDISVASKLSCENMTESLVVNRTAITKPEVPGPISEESDLDPGDDEVIIMWNEPTVGEFTHFKYKMVSVTSYAGVMYSTSQPREPKVQLFMDDFGRKMDTEIRACTSFRGTTACSEKFKTVVSTIGKVPNALRDVVCKTIQPGKIEVSWVPDYRRHGEFTNIEIKAVPVVDALLAIWNNATYRALDGVTPVKVLNVIGASRSAVLDKIPKDRLFVILVYAYNEAGRSKYPGMQSARDFADRYYADPTKSFEAGYQKFLTDLEMNFKVKSFFVPICGGLDAEQQKGKLWKPKQLKAVKMPNGDIAVTWSSPKKGLIAGYSSKVTDKLGKCYRQYDFICVKGCLAEISEHPDFRQLTNKDFVQKLPQPDEKCENYTTVEMSRDQLFPKAKYVMRNLPSEMSLYVQMTTLGYIQSGGQVKKQAAEPKKMKPNQCDACAAPRDLEKIDALACNSTAVYYFIRGRLESSAKYPEQFVKAGGARRMLHENRKARPKKREILLPGSKSTKCACDLLKENPKIKLAFLHLNPTGTNYVIDHIVSLHKQEMQSAYKKYRRTCWKR